MFYIKHNIKMNLFADIHCNLFCQVLDSELLAGKSPPENYHTSFRIDKHTQTHNTLSKYLISMISIVIPISNSLSFGRDGFYRRVRAWFSGRSKVKVLGTPYPICSSCMSVIFLIMFMPALHMGVILLLLKQSIMII